MTKMLKTASGLGLAVMTSFLTVHPAKALNNPTGIQIDGGPLGTLTFSGGMDGYGYYLSGQPDGAKDTGMNVGSALIQLQKNSGILQFTIQVGSSGGGIPVGISGTPEQTTIDRLSTGPLYAGYITVAPTDWPVSIQVGKMHSLEGYEAGTDWYNPSQMTTDIWFVQNSQSQGIQATYTKGPLTATVQYGDGWDTHVFNFLQAAVTYAFNQNNLLYVYYSGNLSKTGLNVRTYGWGSGTTVGEYGPWFMNSQMFGAFYSYIHGNWNIIPEAQYVYAKPDQQLGIEKYTSNLGLAVLGTYSFANTPYSIGGWVEYEKSIGNYYWFAGPQSEGVGAAISPTWQYKDLFARVNAGGFYLLHNQANNGMTYGYGSSGTGKIQFAGTLEAGLLF